MLRSKLLSGVGVGMFAMAVAGCGGSSSSGGGGGSSNVSCTPGAAGGAAATPGGAAAGTFNVCVEADPSTVGKFNPASATVKSGGSVTWIFVDKDNQHTVTYDDGSYDSQPQSVGFTTTQTISKPAGTTIAYHCTLHANMTGKIVVQ